MCIEFAPPPTAELKAASKKAAKGGGGKRSSRKGTVAAAPGLEGGAADLTTAGKGGGIGEKVHHGDFGSGDGREGRWRACLAESGKVGFDSRRSLLFSLSVISVWEAFFEESTEVVKRRRRNQTKLVGLIWATRSFSCLSVRRYGCSCVVSERSGVSSLLRFHGSCGR